MYEAFYGFTEKPFNLTPDPKYLFLSSRHTEAFAHLEFGRQERGGFVVITGEVGTGKTTLARYFLGRLGANADSAFVIYPALTAMELLRSVLQDLHLEATSQSLKDLVDELHRFLLRAREGRRNVVILIDEAQDLSPEVLEQIRLLSNLETDTEKLVQIVLMGQSELHEMLSRRELRQLAQRVTARYHLSPLDRSETSEYLRHRIKVAGGEGKVTFTPSALAAIHRLSGGVPRLVNLIADRALLAGYVASTRSIDAATIERAAREVRGEGPKAPRRLRAALALGLPAFAALGALAYLRTETVPPPAAPSPEAHREEPKKPQQAGGLTQSLLALDRDASLRSAEATVRSLWGEGDLQETALRLELEQVRRLDLPGVMEMFHPERRSTCFVALLGLEGETALVKAGDAAPQTVPASELDRFWTRQASFPWRDFDSVLSLDRSRAASWAGDALSNLGYRDDQSPSLALTRFQRDFELVPDGILGSRSLMALYGAQDRKRPRLVRKAS